MNYINLKCQNKDIFTIVWNFQRFSTPFLAPINILWLTWDLLPCLLAKLGNFLYLLNNEIFIMQTNLESIFKGKLFVSHIKISQMMAPLATLLVLVESPW
jgi:hypothetical protein